MRTFATLALLLGLATSAQAQTASPHAARMKACAAEWQTKKQSSPKADVRYQKFMSDCMKSKSVSSKSQSSSSPPR